MSSITRPYRPYSNHGCPCGILDILDSFVPIKARKISTDIHGGCKDAIECLQTLPETTSAIPIGHRFEICLRICPCLYPCPSVSPQQLVYPVMCMDLSTDNRTPPITMPDIRHQGTPPLTSTPTGFTLSPPTNPSSVDSQYFSNIPNTSQDVSFGAINKPQFQPVEDTSTTQPDQPASGDQ